MKLSDIIDAKLSHYSDSPCAVRQEDDNISSLTYRQASEALKQHEVFLQQAIASSSSSPSEEGRTRVVAYLASNDIDLFLSVLSCTSNRVAALPALANTRWTPVEIAAALESFNNNDETILLYGPNFEQTATKAVALLKHRASCRKLPTVAEQLMVDSQAFPPLRERDDQDTDTAMQQLSFSSDGQGDALVVFTSGTTSGSKGVRLSHRAILVQSFAKLKCPCSYSPSTAMQASTVPFFHVGGLSSILAVWLAGGRLVLPKQERASGFDSGQVLQSISHQQCPSNTLVVVPAMLFAIQNYVDSKHVYPAVELILIGGQSVSQSLLEFLGQIFPNGRIVQTYACTEAASSMTFLDITNGLPSLAHTEISGDCVGFPPEHVELTLLDRTNQSRIMKERLQPGVIATRGPHVMNGYWKRGQHNSNLNPGEWFVTNDLGFWDEAGRLFFCGRVNDVIRTGGETVLALEVERVVGRHPNVAECAVFALPDERFGEAVCCALVCQGQGPQVREIRKWCAEQGLAGYKRPRRVYHVHELPKNKSGKILKYSLKERFGTATQIRSRL